MNAIFAIFHVHPRFLWGITTDQGFPIVNIMINRISFIEVKRVFDVMGRDKFC